METVDVELQSVSKKISNLFKQKGSVTSDQIIDVSKSALRTGIIAVREILLGLLKLVKTLLQKLAQVGNAHIEIPIFTWLYKKINNGRALTLFDAISLVIAVPTTVFAKLITGKTPPERPGLDAVMLGNLMSDDASLSEQVKTDFSILKVEITICRRRIPHRRLLRLPRIERRKSPPLSRSPHRPRKFRSLDRDLQS